MHQFYKKDPSFVRVEMELADLEAAVELKKALLEKMEDDPEFNRFKDGETAEDVLEEKFLERARAACEGSYNLGEDTYTQELYIDDVPYVYTLSVEYNRHDKTYYYIDTYDSTMIRKDPSITEKDVQALINLPDSTLDPRIKRVLEEFKGLKGW